MKPICICVEVNKCWWIFKRLQCYLNIWNSTVYFPTFSFAESFRAFCQIFWEKKILQFFFLHFAYSIEEIPDKNTSVNFLARWRGCDASTSFYHLNNLLVSLFDVTFCSFVPLYVCVMPFRRKFEHPFFPLETLFARDTMDKTMPFTKHANSIKCWCFMWKYVYLTFHWWHLMCSIVHIVYQYSHKTR